MSERDRLELRALKLGWNDERTARLFSRVQTRLSRQKHAWRAALAAAALASLVCVALVARKLQHGGALDTSARLPAPQLIQLREGSAIEVAPGSELRIAEETPLRVRADLIRGSTRYSVVPNPERTFEIRSGVVSVRVVGTQFVLERRGESTWVAVERGKVRVSWGETADAVLLTAGESGLFPRPSAPAPSEQRAALPEQDPVAAANAKEPSARAEQAATQTYRSRVESHDYRGAYAVLDQNPAVAGDTVKDLLLAADVARLSNHPAAAVPYLQRIIHDHPRDERAPMAAFTLGRTLSGLGRTREAMNMFARVQSAWPHSALAEDALLRQAEAASELGDASAARRIAEQYDKSYPNGRRRAEVRRYARLE